MTMEINMNRTTYEAPALTVVGTFEALTQGNASPVTQLDAPYPIKTPFPTLTWS